MITAGGGAFPARHRRLFLKYASLITAVVCTVLMLQGAVTAFWSVGEQEALVHQIHREQAAGAANQITAFIEDIQNQIDWIIPPPWMASDIDEQRLDALRLLRQVPAISALTILDSTGMERLRLSRLEADKQDTHQDLSATSGFQTVKSGKTYYGEVYFQRNSEPFMTIGRGGQRGNSSIVLAEVNLTFIWDVVSSIPIGQSGTAYVVDRQGRLIAHPDIALVLKKTDMAGLGQVQAARKHSLGKQPVVLTTDLAGRKVMAAFAHIPALDWSVIVESPAREALKPVYTLLTTTLLVLAAGVAVAIASSFLLARRMVQPIRELAAGASRIGNGALDHRIALTSGDELEALGTAFNDMAARLHESYTGLERTVAERTRELADANQAKSRFLAAASHDLRQPLHALGLFVAQLQGAQTTQATATLVNQIVAATADLNALFDALLDVSQLDAGGVVPSVRSFDVADLLQRTERTFATEAARKGLRLRVMPCAAFVRSDPVLLERIVMNLVSNAIRYTQSGGVLIGCRKRGGYLRIDIVDTGPGIPEHQQPLIFQEFFRINAPGAPASKGLGLGLSIVQRLAALLGHDLSLSSCPGKGTRFSIAVPHARADTDAMSINTEHAPLLAATNGPPILVIDDDERACAALAYLLRSWGYTALTAVSCDGALGAVRTASAVPALVVTDYHLCGEESGDAVIRALRHACNQTIPAIVISGDAEGVGAAQTAGLPALQKPVSPMRLRAAVAQALRGTRARSG